MRVFHKFIKDYIDKNFFDSEYYNRGILLGISDFVIDVEEEEIIEKGLLKVEFVLMNNKRIVLKSLDVSTNYFSKDNYSLTPMINEKNFEVNLVQVGNKVGVGHTLLFQRDMEPTNINCGIIRDTQIILEEKLFNLAQICEHCKFVLNVKISLNDVENLLKYENEYKFTEIYADTAINVDISIKNNFMSLVDKLNNNYELLLSMMKKVKNVNFINKLKDTGEIESLDIWLVEKIIESHFNYLLSNHSEENNNIEFIFERPFEYLLNPNIIDYYNKHRKEFKFYKRYELVSL